MKWKIGTTIYDIVVLHQKVKQLKFNFVIKRSVHIPTNVHSPVCMCICVWARFFFFSVCGRRFEENITIIPVLRQDKDSEQMFWNWCSWQEFKTWIHTIYYTFVQFNQIESYWIRAEPNCISAEPHHVRSVVNWNVLNS